MRLSPHFDTEEFRCHDGTPAPRSSYAQLRNLCRSYLEPLRASYGPVTVISGYRTRAYNLSVGGAPASFHVYSTARYGVAADVACARGTARQWFTTLSALDPGGLGKYPTHVHVDNRTHHARW